MTEVIHNSTVNTLLNRTSIRRFKADMPTEAEINTLELVAQHAASSQYLNDWSAIRVVDTVLQQKIAEICHQPYVASAPLLYIFVLDEYRNAQIAKRNGVDVYSDEFTLRNSYRFSQAQNDAVLALHAMETAGESMGIGSVILGSIHNDMDEMIKLLHLPEYTYPVLGLALGYPDQSPAIKPRMPREVQFFEDGYMDDPELMMRLMADFDEEVHTYYDLRDPNRPVETFSKQITAKAVARDVLGKGFNHARSQGFELDK